ncbi:Hypothetical_protein [Hexamita inflata]|uniref:Hypothetical_protein n=1 Tax=Hexamita inflata TaxID=28002 RepID=A0AA86RGQ6_9EUKA|nr:Hypothetical protein HINF_LOCUS61511 [Hexamita inflata]
MKASKYNVNRVLYEITLYIIFSVLQLQYAIVCSIHDIQTKVLYAAMKSIKLLVLALIFSKLRGKHLKLENLRIQIIAVECVSVLLTPITNQFFRLDTAVIEAGSLYIIGLFAVQTSHEFLRFVLFAFVYGFLYIFNCWFQSGVYWFSATGVSMFIILLFYFYQERDQNSCIVESEVLKTNKKKFERLFQSHYSQYINEMGESENKQMNTICASIRINFNPKIDQLVQFSRIVEQLCGEYQVKIIATSSKQFQFIVSEEASVQKKFDQALQLCSGAQAIARNLNMTVSAGVAFGEILPVKQIFGNLQYKLFHGDVLELTDFVSQHSFDEILVDATSLYKDLKPPNNRDSKFQHFLEPNFKYKPDVREIQYRGETRVIAVAKPMENMNKQLLQVLMKNSQVAEATLDYQDIAASSDHPTDNKFDSDSQSVTVFTEKSKQMNTQPTINEAVNTIHMVKENQIQIQSDEQVSFKQMLLKQYKEFVQINNIVKIDAISINLGNNLMQNLSHIGSYYLACVSSTFLLIQYNILFNQIDNNSIYIHNQITLQTWLNTQQYLFSGVILVQLLCVVPYFVFNFRTKLNHKMVKTMKSVDLAIQKLLFVITVIWYITILYSFQTMLRVVKNYSHLKQVSECAQTILWTITIYIAHNFNQTISVNSQHPLQISLNFKVFITIELVHWLMVFREHPAMALAMLFVQAEQLPVQVYKYFVAVGNIHDLNAIRLYLKKQASILSRHRLPLQVNSELLLLTGSHSVLQQDIAGDLMVKYEKLQKFSEADSEDKALLVCLHQKAKHQLPEAPVVHVNGCVIFQTEFDFESADKTNEILAELHGVFGERVSMLRSARTSATWISYTNKDLYTHVKAVLGGLFQVLQKHPSVGVKMAAGDLKGIALCYENVFCEMVGEAADEIQHFGSTQGRVKVAKKFWEWLVSKQTQDVQPLQFQKKYIDYGIQVELWK